MSYVKLLLSIAICGGISQAPFTYCGQFHCKQKHKESLVSENSLDHTANKNEGIVWGTLDLFPGMQTSLVRTVGLCLQC